MGFGGRVKKETKGLDGFQAWRRRLAEKVKNIPTHMGRVENPSTAM